MKQEFVDSYAKLFHELGLKRLRKAWMAKLHAMKECKD